MHDGMKKWCIEHIEYIDTHPAIKYVCFGCFLVISAIYGTQISQFTCAYLIQPINSNFHFLSYVAWREWLTTDCLSM